MIRFAVSGCWWESRLKRETEELVRGRRRKKEGRQRYCGVALWTCRLLKRAEGWRVRRRRRTCGSHSGFWLT